MGKLLYAVNSVAVLGLLFAYLSPYVNPSITGFFAIFGLGYPFLIVANLLFFFMWLAFKPKYAILSGLFILLGFYPLKKTIGLNNQENSAKGLTVMTYNIGKTRVDFHHKGREKKIERFRKFVAKESPDIICIQERLPRHLKYYDEIFTGYKLHPSSDIGTAIYSKYPIVEAGNIPFNTKSHNATWADIKVNKDTCRIYSMHLSSNRVPNLTDNVKEVWEESKYILDKYNVHAKMRVEQLEEVLAHADRSPHPVIFNGDFNDVPQSYIYRMIAENYDDAFLAKGSGLAQTFKSRFVGLRIDYTFTDPSIQILDHDILDTDISDHFPVVTTLSL